MQRTRWLLIGLLVLASASCAKRDWVGDMLVLADVTGTWEGWVKGAGYEPWAGGPAGTPSAPITLVLQQTGPKVTGELSWSRGQGRVVAVGDEGAHASLWPSVLIEFPEPGGGRQRRSELRVVNARLDPTDDLYRGSVGFR
jgi:hypothetical protein